MKPLYLKVKEIKLRYEQIDNRINECERSIKNHIGLDEIKKLENNALYYSELERKFATQERLELKLAKAAEYEAQNNFYMAIKTASDLSFNARIKSTLKDRIINYLFIRHPDVQETIISGIINDQKKAAKGKSNLKDE
jgi:hypothetical protein